MVRQVGRVSGRRRGTEIASCHVVATVVPQCLGEDTCESRWVG